MLFDELLVGEGSSHPMWIPLHVHSQYSILDAIASVQAIAQKAAALGLGAVALTDHGNLFGAIDFYKACYAVGVKPIIGCEFYVAPHSRHTKEKESGWRTSYHLTLLAKNEIGYHNLCKLSSLGYLEGFYYHPRIDQQLLELHHEGIICLSGCLSSRVAREVLQGTADTLLAQVQWYHQLFGDDYYFELQRHTMSEIALEQDGFFSEPWRLQRYQESSSQQEKVNQALIALSKQLSIPLVATNDSHYIERHEWRSHEIFLNIQSGEPCEIWEKDSLGQPKFRLPNPKRMTYPSNEHYFKSAEQMAELFADLPEALQTSCDIAAKCELSFDFKARHYPVYLPPALQHAQNYTKEEQQAASTQYLWQLCEEGISRRYTSERLAKIQQIFPEQEPMQVVRERLNYEMGVIIPKGMGDYLLIVWDFIHWAKSQGIPMGPGRGSGAGSIVLYLIGVTDIEPLRFHLFFERFINPERPSYPDIDVDICMDRRQDVIHYTLKKYGHDKVAQIITFQTMKARMAIKDVGRVLSVPLAKVNSICKLVPEDLNITIEKALEKDAELRQLVADDEEVQRVIAIARQLEGSIRGTGIHAAGLIIAGEPLMELIPICNAKDSTIPATQYSMKPIELVGMLKIDFLGLTTLTAIQHCVADVAATTGNTIDWINLPLDDSATFALLNQGKTMGVFQLESPGMQELARQLHLDCFEEIIAVGALYRPGPMDMIPSFIQRKHGVEPIDYDHPWMKQILAETYGIMVYQEQVMQIASKLAGYSLGEGDVLRRAMGKKDQAEMGRQREKFRLGALQNNIEPAISMAIFDKMEKFASYGFNKSHAAAYGYLSYVTAYLKANYAREWMAALMTCAKDDLTKVAKFMREAKEMHIAILPPDVNEAGKAFVATFQGIRFAMHGIKGVGEAVVDAVIEERQRGGPFLSLYNFFKRVDIKRVGKKSVEQLIDAGCFDFTGWSRDALANSVEAMFASVSKEQKEQAKGFLSLFDMIGESEEKRFQNPPPVPQPRTALALLVREKELLGLFLTGHPLASYHEVLQRLSCVPLDQIEQMAEGTLLRAAFILETVDVRLSQKTQKKFAITRISDGFTSFELPIWPDLFEEKQPLLHENQLLYAILQVELYEGQQRLSCRWLDDLTRADEAMIVACDSAFDRLKFHAAMRAGLRAGPRAGARGGGQYNQRAQAKEKDQDKERDSPAPAATAAVPKSLESYPAVNPQKTMSHQIIRIDLDADLLRMSHILRLKELFALHSGAVAVHLRFFSKQALFATLHVDSRLTVQLGEPLLAALQQLGSAIRSIHHPDS